MELKMNTGRTLQLIETFTISRLWWISQKYRRNSPKEIKLFDIWIFRPLALSLYFNLTCKLQFSSDNAFRSKNPKNIWNLNIQTQALSVVFQFWIQLVVSKFAALKSLKQPFPRNSVQILFSPLLDVNCNIIPISPRLSGSNPAAD